MATRRQPLIPGWLIPGVSAATLVVAVALAAFLALWWNAPQGNWVAVWQDSYLWHVVRFSFWQAFLSALLSVVPAIFLARALYRRRFPEVNYKFVRFIMFLYLFECTGSRSRGEN